MRTSLDKICKQNQNKHFVFKNFFLNGDVYEIMWDNMVQRGHILRYSRTHALGMLDISGYRTHLQYMWYLLLCMENVVTWRHPNVTLYVSILPVLTCLLISNIW